MDRDGQTVAECPKGWQYIADMTNTNVRNEYINMCILYLRVTFTGTKFYNFSSQRFRGY